MNLTLASFLVEEKCRAIKVEYDPDVVKNNSHTACQFFKTLDPTIAKDDLVIVPTSTRHKFTIVKVLEVDLTVNYDSNTDYQWIGGKFDATAFAGLLEADKEVVKQVGKIEADKKKRELAEAMGLTSGAVPGYGSVKLAAPA